MLHRAVNRGQIAEIKDWVLEQLPDPTPFEVIYGVAVLANDPPHEILAAMIYSSYSENNVFISGAIAPDAVGRVTAGDLSKALSVAFDEPLNVHRVTALVSKSNKRSRVFMTKLGFTHEGTLRDYDGPGTKTLVYGLTRNDFMGGAYGRRRQRWQRGTPTGLQSDDPRSGILQSNQSVHA
jgi:RimJ/RimL family protein N-acetyltransferase